MFDDKVQELVNFDFIPTDLLFQTLHLSKSTDEVEPQQNNLDEPEESYDS
jgi:hypothetical protein